MSALSRRDDYTDGWPSGAVRLDRIISVGIVGAGRVGAVLGAALARAGHHVVAVAAVSAASVARAGQLLPGVEIRPIDQVAAGADLLLLAVSDDALAGLVRGLVEAG